MTKYKLEYIWLDGYTPVPNLRGKTQIKVAQETAAACEGRFPLPARPACRQARGESDRLAITAQPYRRSEKGRGEDQPDPQARTAQEPRAGRVAGSRVEACRASMVTAKGFRKASDQPVLQQRMRNARIRTRSARRHASASGGNTAHRNVVRRAQPETSSSQP